MLAYSVVLQQYDIDDDDCSDGACLQTDDGSVVSNTVTTNVLNFLPGQIFTADDQCYFDRQTTACGDVSLSLFSLTCGLLRKLGIKYCSAWACMY